jgi:predicted amidohydrolase YtcJ
VSHPPAIALVGGRVRTLDPHDTVAEAILVEGGRVTAVGDGAAIAARAGDARVVDLGGRTVLPGLIDAHAHLEISTLADRHWDEMRGLDPQAMLDRVRAAAAERTAGDWIVGQGTFGQELPTREELDAAAPEHPVILRSTLHRLVASSRALEAAGIDRGFVQRPAIRVLRDEHGEPTGVAEEAFDLFPVPHPSTEWLEDALPRQAREGWARHGVTTIRELPASPAGIAAWQRLDADGAMPCRITLNPILAPGHQATVQSVEEITRPGFTTGFGSEWLRMGALKLFLDGAGPAAWTREQLSRPPREWGLMGFGYEELIGILAACRRAGIQVWMHAVGDAAQEFAVDAVEEVNHAFPGTDHRTRIDHIGADTGAATLTRLRDAGIVPAPTVAFMHEGGAEPGPHHYPFATMLRLGLRPPGNSDSAGTQPWATNPWQGIHTMVTRRDRRGRLAGPAEEAIDVAAAVRTYTHHGAWSAFEEHRAGALAPGMLGDLAVYADDPLTMPIEELPGIVADLTVVGGRVVHGGEG